MSDDVGEAEAMTQVGPGDAVVEAFERERGRLVAVARRILGSEADAEDAVQEAWLRLARQDAGGIDNLAGWLTTVVGRVCLDQLRARRARPEAPADERLPEWVVSEDDDADPETSAVLADSVGLALLVVLDALRPDERLAFVLHDVFAVPFDEVGPVVGRSPDAAKMLASRARRKVQGAQRPDERRQQREVVDAFLAAAREGDMDGLLRVLDPDLTWRVHTAHGEIVRHGAAELARHALLGPRAKAVGRRVLVDGAPGVATWRADGRPLAVMACTVSGGRIVEVESVTDPERLAAMSLPAR